MNLYSYAWNSPFNFTPLLTTPPADTKKDQKKKTCGLNPVTGKPGILDDKMSSEYPARNYYGEGRKGDFDNIRRGHGGSGGFKERGKNGRGLSGWLGALQGLLDLGGLVPVEIRITSINTQKTSALDLGGLVLVAVLSLDLANVGISYARGDYIGVSLSMSAMISIFENFGTVLENRIRSGKVLQ